MASALPGPPGVRSFRPPNPSMRRASLHLSWQAVNLRTNRFIGSSGHRVIGDWRFVICDRVSSFEFRISIWRPGRRTSDLGHRTHFASSPHPKLPIAEAGKCVTRGKVAQPSWPWPKPHRERRTLPPGCRPIGVNLNALGWSRRDRISLAVGETYGYRAPPKITQPRTHLNSTPSGSKNRRMSASCP